ncbi:hypothetical protein ACRHM7_17880 [Chromohalobacter israelensis]|uniref:hypothetical protein n=1 Tax=Chromohalobacter israelensis TaxID=141390 RepID=UPI003D7A3ABB
MPWLDEPFYATGPTTGSNVYVGGKPPGVAVDDFQKGLARMGGFWRHPSYLESYLTASSLLIAQGTERQDYDDIGLPAFYLQRHATELLLKQLLRWCIDIIELKSALAPSTGHRVPSKCCRALERSHDLNELLKALQRTAKLAGENPPPDNLTDLVDSLTGVEADDHWSRYDHGLNKGERHTHHKTETTIPIVKLQKLLEEAVGSTIYRSMGVETYEDELHTTWSGLNSALESRD